MEIESCNILKRTRNLRRADPLPRAITRQRRLVSRSRAIYHRPTCAVVQGSNPTEPTKKRGGSAEKLTLEQIKQALANTSNNITEAAIQLRCHRDTLYNYIQRYPELQEHRRQVVAAMCDMARSNVHHAVVAGDVRTSIVYLSKHDPEWAERSTIKHKGTIQHEVQPAGPMSRGEIEALSDAELKRLIAVLKAEQADVEAEIARTTAQGPD
jgi:hypothetical protein